MRWTVVGSSRHAATVVFALFAVWAGAAAAEQRVDGAMLVTSEDAAHFGEYTDLDDEGVHFVGGLDFSGRAGWVGSDAGYWSLSGRNLGLQTYDVLGEFGRQGRYGVEFELDGTRQFKRGDGVTPFRGGNDLRLAATWVPAPITSGMSDLLSSASFDQVLERDALRFRGHVQVGSFVTLTAQYERETKDGTRVEGASIYSDASNPSTVLIPLPVDYQTQHVSFNVQYAASRFTTTFAYNYSDFDNDDSQVIWQNPYAPVISTAADYPDGQGSLSLAPDNHRHELRLTGLVRPLPRFNVQWDGSWAHTEQDDRFLPYSANPALVVSEPLPQARLDGGLDVVTVNVRANFRPRKWRKLTLRGAYHLDDRDVDKSRDPYRYIRGDGADQPAAELAIFNIARDVEREGFELAGDYRVARRGKLTIRYTYEQVERQHAAVGKTETDSYEGVFRIAPWQGITFRLEGGLTDRGASDYDASQSFFAARTAEFIDQTPADQRFDNHPLLRQSHLANRETTHVRLRAVVSRQAPWHFSLDYLWRDTDYDRSQLGLTDSETNRVSLDAQYVPGDAFTAHAFYSYENYDSKEGGRAFLGGIEKPANRVVPPLPQGSDPTRDWSVRRGDDVHSVGAGVSWDIVPERWDLEAQYLWVFTEASTHFGSGGAADLDTTPLPDLETRLHSIDLRANLRLRTSLVVSFRYAYYRYEEDDWGLNGVDVATLDNVLGLGEREDDESVNLFGISVRYGF